MMTSESVPGYFLQSILIESYIFTSDDGPATYTARGRPAHGQSSGTHGKGERPNKGTSG